MGKDLSIRDQNLGKNKGDILQLANRHDLGGCVS